MNIRQHLARANRRQLIDVAHDQEGGLVRNCLHQRLHQHDVDHGGLVDHQQVAIERVVVAALEATTLGLNLQEPVDGFGIEAGRLGHALGGAAGRGTEQKARPLGRQNAQDRPAATWLSARMIPIRFSTHGNALSGSIQGQG
jgi:hypothetical protein